MSSASFRTRRARFPSHVLMVLSPSMPSSLRNTSKPAMGKLLGVGAVRVACGIAIPQPAPGMRTTLFEVFRNAGKCYLWARSRPRLLQVSRMKKLKHEAELFKGALLAGVKYAEGRKAVEFEPTDSASQKLLYIYRLLVHDKIIQPLPEDQVAEATMRHKLAIWYSSSCRRTI